ncbi:TPR repeat-containing protein YsoA [Weizmannia acidilactici]|uniref:tetratricopeptide repeat protein n=1 Tax=Weizmannia acidilactici TaxID=2607726 RepID=UPI00124BE498|nr:tetratricopeptide repeat protein [Weizmannia acidilactici]GER66155.1 TPR repeat-containing protein YsoA [Weizmannia acidilactici]
MKNEKSNVVPFPRLKERLLERGLESISQKEYKEAAALLRQARTLDREDADVGTALMIALYQSGDYEGAKEQGRQMLHEGIGNYFEVMDLFLMILVQLGEHEETVRTISALLEEKEAPLEKLDHYEKLLAFSEKRVQLPKPELDPDQKGQKLFESDDLQEQILRVSRLVHENIRPYIGEIRGFIRNPDEHPFIQTLLINVLKEQGISDTFEIQKLNRHDTVNPAELLPIFETQLYNLLITRLSRDVEQKNPTLYAHIKTMVDRHFFLLYPFEPEPLDTGLWTAAYYSMGLKIYGQDECNEKIAMYYSVNPEELADAVRYLESLEEISLPNL